jgi:spermidine/putrescine transport system substrate-binding protein
VNAAASCRAIAPNLVLKPVFKSALEESTMSYLKRFWIYITLCFATAYLITACSSNTPQATGGVSTQLPAATEAKTLNIYNWSTYIAPEVLTEFEKTFNTKIKYDTFESNDALYAKLKPGNPGYDVAFPADYMVQRMSKEGMLEELDQVKIPNQKNLDPKFVDTAYDPGNKYSMPYQWGTLGVGYNVKDTGSSINSWKDLFDTKYVGKVAVLDDVRYTLGCTLILLGFDPNTTNPDEINKAKDFLIQHKKSIKAFAPDTGQELLDQGEVDLTLEYSGDIFQVMKENKDLRYTIPKEGTIIWTDNMVVPKGAPHKDIAMEFINFILDAQRGATISNFIRYATPNLAARQQGFINPKDLKDPAIYPPPELYAKLKYVQDVGQAITLYDDAWTEIKAGMG